MKLSLALNHDNGITLTDDYEFESRVAVDICKFKPTCLPTILTEDLQNA